jgi:hypothetical protein
MVGVSCKMQSNDTKLAGATGKISMDCDECGLTYETQACWAKRVNNHFCSKGCSDKYSKVEIKKACQMCEAEFITNPTTYFKHVTCSSKCKKKKYSIQLLAEWAEKKAEK